MNAVRRIAVVAAIAVLVLAVGAGNAFALPPAGTVYGFVLEAGTGTPVAGAVVEVWDDSLTPGVMAWSGYSVTAGFSGDYSIGGLPAGNYELHAADPGGTHFGEVVPVTFDGTTLAVNITMDVAGRLAGTVMDSGSNDLPGAKVFLFSSGFFPFPSAPDPGPRTTGALGDYAFGQVVDPLNAPDLLLGDFVVAAFEPEHVGQFFWQSADLTGATPVHMGISDWRTADFTLGSRTMTSLAPPARLNGTGSAIFSDKMSVRRGGDLSMAWYDFSLGGVVAKFATTESLVATFAAAPYDGMFDVNNGAVFFGDGTAWSPTGGHLDSGYADIKNAQVVCDNNHAAFLYEVFDAGNIFMKRSWRIRVVELASGNSQSFTFQRPMGDQLKVSPGGINGGVVAFTIDTVIDVGGVATPTGKVYTFDYASPAGLTEVYSSVDYGAFMGAESAIVWGDGTHVLVLDQAANLINDVEIATLNQTTVADFTAPALYYTTLSGLRADGTQGSYVFTGTDFLNYPLYDATLYFGEAQVPDSYTPIKNAPVVGNGALDEPSFTDYDYSEAGFQMASMVGAIPGDYSHVYSLLFGDTDWLRNDLVDRFAPADHRAPDAGSGGVAWLDWRTASAALSGLPDVYYRKPGGTEKVIATRAYDLSEEAGLPQVSSRWVAYAMAGTALDTVSFEAYDLSNDTTRAVKADVPLASDGSATYAPLTGLTGDWFAWVGGDRVTTAELRIRNILTGEERMLASISTPAVPYQVYFKASGGKVLYADAAGVTHLYDIASDADTVVPTTLPIDASFYSFEFDYPRAAYLDPMYENATAAGTEQVGTLKTYDFRTDSVTTLEEFFVIDTGRSGGKPFALWKQALVAGSHIYDLNAGTEYSFPTAKAPAFVSIDATLVAAEISPAVPSPSGLPEGDVYTVDVSSFVDAVPPHTFVTGVPSGLTTVPVWLEFTATDGAGSGVYQLSAGIEPQGNAITGGSPSSMLVYEEGTQTVTYSSVDMWGNQDVEHTATVVYDAAPETTLTVTAGTMGENGWYVTPVTFSLTATDTGSGVAQTFYSIDGGTAATYHDLPITVSGDGVHTVASWSVDKHGVVEAPAQVASFKIDSTRPTVITDLKRYYEGRADWSVVASDTMSGPRTLRQYLELEGVGIIWPWAETGGTTTNPGVVGTGEYTFGYDAIDNAGLHAYPAGAEPLVRFTVGTVSTPESSASVAPAPNVYGWYRLSGPTLTITATDTAGGLPGAGVADIYYRMGSVTTTYTAPFQVSLQGTTTVEYWSVDNVGNEETPHKTVVVKYDNVDPTVTHDGVAFYEGAGTITVTGHDSTSGPWRTEYMLAPAGGFTSGPDGAPVSFSVGAIGTHSFEYLCSDYAGNMSTYGTHPSFSYYVGAVSTPLTTIGGAPSDWVNHDVALSVTATDTAGGQPGSGVADIKWRFGSTGGFTSATGASAVVNVSAQGTTTVEAYATDNVGNSETPHQFATVRIDKTGPQFSDDRLPSYSGVTDAWITLTATDLESRVTAFEYRLDGAATQTVPVGSAVTTLAVPVHVGGAGSHTLAYSAANGAGTRTSASMTLAFGKVSSTITLRTSAYSSVRRRPFVLSGVLTPATVGTPMVVEVKKPGSGRWSYSSARLCYSLAAGGGANWWYRYTPLLRGTYTFRSRYDGNASTLGCYSPNTVAVRIR